jgi:mannosyltransferase OCH1-like enzyme
LFWDWVYIFIGNSVMRIYSKFSFVHLTAILITFSLNIDAKSIDKPIQQKTSNWEFASFFPDFETGMLRENRSYYIYEKFFNKKKQNPVAQQRRARFNLLQNTYNRAAEYIRKNAHSSNIKIPRIIHQIWLGSGVPKRYKEWMESWMNWHGWEYKLWTDEDVAGMQLVNQEAYDAAANYGEKSDILRVEVLYLMGGLYVDVDFKCVAPAFFDLLHRTTDFYIGIEPLEHELLRFCNCLMGSVSGHPLLAKIIDNLADNSKQVKRNNPLDRTGPRYITRMVCEYIEAQSDPSEINLPLTSVTFFPYSGHEFYNGHEPFEKNVNTFPPLKGTAAIHYWTGSWALPPGRMKG